MLRVQGDRLRQLTEVVLLSAEGPSMASGYVRSAMDEGRPAVVGAHLARALMTTCGRLATELRRVGDDLDDWAYQVSQAADALAEADAALSAAVGPGAHP